MSDGYEKDAVDVLLDYMPSDIEDYEGTDFDLRITFGDDTLEQAFWVTVPGDAENLTLRELLRKHLLGETREDRERIRGSLDTDTNPDLPAMHLAIRRAFDDQERDKAKIAFHINKGPLNVSLDDPIRAHFSRAYSARYDFDYRLIDLVMVVTETPKLAIPPERQAELIRGFRLLLLLYLMDRYGKDFEFGSLSGDTASIEAAADWGVTKGLLDLSSKQVGRDYKPVYSRTEAGRRTTVEAVRETDNLIKRYDQFADVTLDDPPRFRTGRGEDLRIWVYQAEGIDPLRAAFLNNMETGYYDQSWPEVFRSDDFFIELAKVTTVPCPVTPQKLDRIIRAGKAWADDNADVRRREARAADIWGNRG